MLGPPSYNHVKGDRRNELGVMIDIVLKQAYQINPAECTMAEIGSFKGESTEIWCENFKKVYAIDPWQNGYDLEDGSSENVLMETIEEQFDIRTTKYQDSGKLVKIKKTSMETVDEFEKNSLDFVYIDGNHIFDFVNDDIKHWREKTTILGGHDFGWIDINGINSVFMACKLNFDRPPDTILPDTSWIYHLENYEQNTKMRNSIPCNCYEMAWEDMRSNYKGTW